MCKKNLSSQEIFDLLQSEISNKDVGKIVFKYLDLTVDIDDKNSVGYILQSWLKKWLDARGIMNEVNDNSQIPPDFYIGKTKQHLELKTFDMEASANFDVANFEAYCDIIVKQPDHLYADYLIIGYTLTKGELRIQKMWIKKVWEITCGSAEYPIKTQNKRGMIYNIRPATWDSDRARYCTFPNEQDFVNALYRTLLKYPKTTTTAKKWLSDVKSSYKKFFKKDLF